MPEKLRERELEEEGERRRKWRLQRKENLPVNSFPPLLPLQQLRPLGFAGADLPRVGAAPGAGKVFPPFHRRHEVGLQSLQRGQIVRCTRTE